MSNTVIKVENVSKQYRLGQIGTGSMAHDVNRLWHRLRGKPDPYIKIGEENDRTRKGDSEYVWALNDINFEVKQGDVLGVIGRNGAGKSTLLKLLSRTTLPTTGNIKIKGRIASLLEVGTGFHPELTGRENIYLNGAILGMTKAEIKRNFDSIVDFSGVEKYIDTPVKRYSSGMYVRLAFAVAAHLESEILIVDEVLAVGDAEFQKKALGKMKDVSKNDGRTVLFVSHNIQAIVSLTNKAILLHNGRINFIGSTDLAIGEYLNLNLNKSGLVYKDENVSNQPKITSVEIKTTENGNVHIHGDTLIFFVDVYLVEPLKNGALSIQIFNSSEIAVVHFWLFDSDIEMLRKSGMNRLKCIVPKCRLFLGKYSVTVYLSSNDGRTLLQVVEKICPFEIEMLKTLRVHPWQEGSSNYLDDFFWEVS